MKDSGRGISLSKFGPYSLVVVDSLVRRLTSIVNKVTINLRGQRVSI